MTEDVTRKIHTHPHNFEKMVEKYTRQEGAESTKAKIEELSQEVLLKTTARIKDAQLRRRTEAPEDLKGAPIIMEPSDEATKAEIAEIRAKVSETAVPVIRSRS